MKFKIVGAIVWFIFFALVLASIIRSEAKPPTHHIAKVLR